MPSWLAAYVLPLILPALTPVAIDLVKKAADWLGSKLPGSVVAILAGTLAEAANQLTGAQLPYGLGGFIAIVVNELRDDLAKRKVAAK